ncbi:CBS domain-containing protein [Alkalilimnicola sp. S0819]|nr:CBS domain-containing protein [Alkalilimnicola sp. S0819]MPQ15811.1 CBS domain-containing protein [Alkalilimnicola sp. S0819]
MLALPPQASVAAAVEMMNQRNVGAIVVLDEERVQGIFTERDALRRVIQRRLDVESTDLSEVMTRQLAVIRPSTSIQEALAVVNAKGVRHLPVMEGETLLGLLSVRDLVQYLVEDQQHQIEELVDYIHGQYGPSIHG